MRPYAGRFHRCVALVGAVIDRLPIPSPGGRVPPKGAGEEWRNVGCGKKPGKVFLLLGYRPHSSSVTAGAVPPVNQGMIAPGNHID